MHLSSHPSQTPEKTPERSPFVIVASVQSAAGEWQSIGTPHTLTHELSTFPGLERFAVIANDSRVRLGTLFRAEVTIQFERGCHWVEHETFEPEPNVEVENEYNWDVELKGLEGKEINLDSIKNQNGNGREWFSSMFKRASSNTSIRRP